MPFFRKKPVVIEAITFDDLVEHGKQSGANIVNGMPWSFSYKGHPITHENDACYIIPTLEGNHHFTPQDMLITGVNGEIYPCKKDIFAKTYEPAESTVDVIKFTANDGAIFFAKETISDVEMLETVRRMGGCRQIDRIQMTESEYNAIPATAESAKVFEHTNQ